MLFINTHLTPFFPKTHFTPVPHLTSNHRLGPVKITLEFTTIIAALAEPPFKAGSVLRFITSNAVGNDV
nr:hypothetical protein CFP56_75916 [Quercus suber]